MSKYISQIHDIISQQSGKRIFVLPEYCWGDISFQQYNDACQVIWDKLGEGQYILLGTYPQRINETRYNIAVFAGNQGIISKVQKTRVLSDEMQKHDVSPGVNSAVVQIGQLRIGIIICADIWDHSLLDSLVKDQQADLLLIPAFTIVPVNHAGYALSQWKSLAVVRSREYLVPLAIADHRKGGDNYDVGHCTCIVTPSWKSPDMKTVDDFLSLPEDGVAVLDISLDSINTYRQYREEKGLYQKKSSRDN